MKKSFVLLFLFLVFLGCDPMDSRLNIVNRFDRKIYFIYSKDSILSEIKIDKYEFSERVLDDKWYFVNMNDSSFIGLRGYNTWEKYIKYSKSQEIYFYFFIDTIAYKYDLDSIIENKLYTRKSYTLEELEKSNWVVTYP